MISAILIQNSKYRIAVAEEPMDAGTNDMIKIIDAYQTFS
ncbi:hypothetical protein EMIT036CA2_50237 [Chryseobacterium sp. IT-36CA2]